MGNQHTKSAFRSSPPTVFNNNDLIRIVMVGKTGVGKSASGNTILGQKCFKSELSSISLTQHCEKAYGEVDRQKIAVIDTPGLFDTRDTEEKTIKNIVQSIAFASPGPHIFLIIIKADRFTDEEKQTVQNIQEIFGEEAYKYSMVLFTHGDQLKEKPIEELLKDSKDLQELVAKCNGQYHMFNNELKTRSQVSELLEKIKKINKQNGGTYYTTEMFQNAERLIEQEKQRILNEKKEETGRKLEELEKETKKKYQQMQKECLYNNEVIRIVMLGKTGAGKSATGNTILGKKCFKSEFDMKSVTKECGKAVGEVDGQKVAVIDTPGLFDTSNTEKETVKDISQSIAYASPGPHIFLIIIKLDRYTDEEKQTVQKIQEIFGEEADKYSMILFTHGDQLKGKPIEEFWKKSTSLQELVSKCNGHYHMFNNEEKEDCSQVSELLKKIKIINEDNGGNYYTTESFKNAEKVIEEEKQRILKKKTKDLHKDVEMQIKEKYQPTLSEVKGDKERDELNYKCAKEIENRMNQLMENLEHEARKTAEESDLVKEMLINLALNTQL